MNVAMTKFHWTRLIRIINSSIKSEALLKVLQVAYIAARGEHKCSAFRGSGAHNFTLSAGSCEFQRNATYERKGPGRLSISLLLLKNHFHTCVKYRRVNKINFYNFFTFFQMVSLHDYALI
jgi:hypothetical protein